MQWPLSGTLASIKPALAFECRSARDNPRKRPQGEGIRIGACGDTSSHGRFALKERAPATNLYRSRLCAESDGGADTDEDEAKACLELAERAEPELWGPNAEEWLDRLERDREPLRSALTWFRTHGDAERALRLGGSLCLFWQERGHLEEGRTLLAAVLSIPDASPPTLARAKALYGAGTLAFRRGDANSARAYQEESLAISEKLEDANGVARACIGLARVGLLVGDYEAVRSRGEQALTIWKALGDEQGIGRAIHHLAEGARLEGDYERAGALYNESLAIHRRLKDEYVIAGEYQNLAYVEKHKGDFARAAELFRESLKISLERRDLRVIPYPVVGLGAVAAARGDYARAARLLSAGDRLFEESGAVIDPGDRPEFDRAVALAKKGLKPNAFTEIWAEGRAMSREQAIKYAVNE